MLMSPQWHVLYTRHRWETRVTERLADKKMEYYCPVNRVEKQNWKKTVPQVLFPSWVFVQAVASELAALRQVNGVVNLVYWLGKPVIVPDSEMESVFHFVNDHQEISLERIAVHAGAARKAILETSFPSFEQYSFETLVVPSLGVSLSAMVRVTEPVVIHTETDFNGLRYAIS